MPAEDIKRLFKRRELYKLVLAHDAVNSALNAVDMLIGLEVTPDHELFSVLQESAIISYGRPFTEMDPVGILSTRWGRYPDPAHQRLHGLLIQHRNEMVAHSGYIARKVIIHPPGTLKIKQPDGSVNLNTDINRVVKNSYFSPNAFPVMRAAFQDISDRLNQDIQPLLTELYGDRDSSLGLVELLTQEDLEQLEMLAAQRKKLGSTA